MLLMTRVRKLGFGSDSLDFYTVITTILLLLSIAMFTIIFIYTHTFTIFIFAFFTLKKKTHTYTVLGLRKGLFRFSRLLKLASPRKCLAKWGYSAQDVRASWYGIVTWQTEWNGMFLFVYTRSSRVKQTFENISLASNETWEKWVIFSRRISQPSGPGPGRVCG